MKLTWQRLQLKLLSPFRTSQALRCDRETLWVQLEHEGIIGWGEAVPMDTYHQSITSAEAALYRISSMMSHWPKSISPTHIESIIEKLLEQFDDQRATISAVDAALHDWIGKRYDISVSNWLGLDAGELPRTSYTIGIDEPEMIAAKTHAAESYPILKVKVGTPNDERTLSIIRNIAPDKTLRVDANMAWSVEQALEMIPRLVQFNIEFVEQPIAAGINAGWRQLKETGLIPIVADESCIRPADVVALAGCVDGINIKLSKCGGIRQAIRMIHLAQGLGLKTMLGCMVESSLGIAAAAQLAPLVDWLDLDGHLLLERDPFTGLACREGLFQLAGGAGLGVRPAE